MSSKMKKKRTYKNDNKIWTEEQYEQYMENLYGLDFIAGFTDGGVPYGIPLDIDSEENLYNNDSEELPFS